MPNQPRPQSNLSWWGEWEIAEGQARYWRIGPFELWIERQRHEWVIKRRQGKDPVDSTLEIATDRPVSEGDETHLEIDRVAANSDDRVVSIRPQLADRTVVVHPRSPFHILEGASVELFVSSPLWVSIAVHSGPQSKTQSALSSGEDAGNRREVMDVPAFRPSDTWFGESTLVGESAYAITTSCRVDIEGLPLRPHRATTPILIDNHGSDRLTFERIAVPVRNLSLYRGTDGQLWTEALKLTRKEEGSGVAETEILREPPSGTSVPISQPRQSESARIQRVFESLF